MNVARIAASTLTVENITVETAVPDDNATWLYRDVTGRTVSPGDLYAPGADTYVTSTSVLAALAEANNRGTIETQAREIALPRLQQIIDAAPATFSNLNQAQTAFQQLQAAVQDVARYQRKIIRLVLGAFDGTD